MKLPHTATGSKTARIIYPGLTAPFAIPISSALHLNPFPYISFTARRAMTRWSTPQRIMHTHIGTLRSTGRPEIIEERMLDTIMMTTARIVPETVFTVYIDKSSFQTGNPLIRKKMIIEIRSTVSSAPKPISTHLRTLFVRLLLLSVSIF